MAGHSVFNPSLAKHTAESLGLDNIPDDALTALTQDMEYRLREVIQEAKKFMRHSHRSFLTTQDIHSALATKNVEPILGYHVTRPIRFKKTADNIFYLEDEELDFDKVLAAPLPKLPVDASVSAHWLAIDGVQPLIPQNPSPVAITRFLYLASLADKRSSLHASPNAVDSNPSLVKDVLSREFQLYYEKITDAVTGSDTDIQAAALDSVASDPGLQALLPYFVHFSNEKVTAAMRDRQPLDIYIDFLERLLNNPHLFPEPYLHQVIPLLLSIVLSKRPELDKPGNGNALPREHASCFLASITSKYADQYPTLLSRVTRTLLVALVDDARPLPTKCGAVRALSLLGQNVIQRTLVPLLSKLGQTVLEPALGEAASADMDNLPMEPYVVHLRDNLVNAIASVLPSYQGSSVDVQSYVVDQLEQLGVSEDVGQVILAGVSQQLLQP